VPEQYVHRIGRTARAGADGVAVSFVAPDEKPYIRSIERLTRVKLEALGLPEDFQNQAARLPAPSRKAPAQPQGQRNRNGGGKPKGQQQRGGGKRGDDRREDRRDERRDERRHDRPQGERPRQDAPHGERRAEKSHEDGGQGKRRFRPRGPKGVGAHKNKVRRAG
jgi:ATP-dependent RNA helicase RhlE